MPEALVAPLAMGCEGDDEIREHDQRVPLPPAGVPGCARRSRDADQRLGEQDEARDELAGSSVMRPRYTSQKRAAATA